MGWTSSPLTASRLPRLSPCSLRSSREQRSPGLPLFGRTTAWPCAPVEEFFALSETALVYEPCCTPRWWLNPGKEESLNSRQFKSAAACCAPLVPSVRGDGVDAYIEEYSRSAVRQGRGWCTLGRFRCPRLQPVSYKPSASALPRAQVTETSPNGCACDLGK